MNKPVVEQLSLVKTKKEQRLLTVFGRPEDSPQVKSLMDNGFQVSQISAAASEHGFAVCILFEKFTEEKVVNNDEVY